MTDKEIANALFAKLKQIYNSRDFVLGVMSNATHPDDRKTILDFIEKGEEVTTENLILLSVDLDIKRKKSEAAKQ